MLRVSTMDAGMLHAETPEMPMHTMGVLLLERPAHSVYDRLRRGLHKRLHLIEPFRRRLVAGPLQIGDPHWLEDPDFDLDNHLYHTALPRRAARASSRPTPATWPAACSIARGRCGRCTWWRGCAAARSR